MNKYIQYQPQAPYQHQQQQHQQPSGYYPHIVGIQTVGDNILMVVNAVAVDVDMGPGVGIVNWIKI